MKTFLFLSTFLLAAQALPKAQNEQDQVEEPVDEVVEETVDEVVEETVEEEETVDEEVDEETVDEEVVDGDEPAVEDGDEPDVELTLEPVEEVVTEQIEPGENGGVAAEADQVEDVEAFMLPVPLILDAPWEEFSFGVSGSIGSPTYTTNYPDDELIQITDAYCRGDWFTLVVDGVDYEMTPNVPATCDGWTGNPDEAFADPNFSSGSFLLPGGSHDIQIRVEDSPFEYGAAFVRTVSLPDECTLPGSGFVVLTDVDVHANGDANCSDRGYQFADVTTENIEDVSEVVFDCIGPFARAWIKSWYGNTYGDACLAIHLGPVLPGASVNVPASCEEPLPTVCQV